MKDSRRDLWILAVLVLVVYLPGINARDLWNPDEPRYAEVAREMLLADAGPMPWFVPHLNGALYTQKPPLLFWSMAAFGGLFTWWGGEMNEVAARLPSLLAALVAVLFVYRLGALLFDRQIGFWSALVFGTCFKIIWQGHVGQIDMLLTALVTVAMFYWAKGWTASQPRFYWLFFVFAGLATMAKGPVGLLPPLLSIVAYCAWRDRAALKALPIFRGLLLWAGVVLCWLGPALHWGGELYQREILFKQNVTRYVDPWHHYQPPYYYLTVLPGDFMPWSLLLPAAILVAWRGLQGVWRERFWWLSLWVLVTLVFFSVSPAKRTVYILTLYPALALLVGLGLVLIARKTAELSRWWTRGPVLFLTLLFALAAVAALIVGPRRPEVAVLGADLPLWLAGVFGGVALCFAMALRHLWAERFESFLYWKAAAFGVFAIALFTVILPRLDVVKSARPLSERYLELAPQGEPYAIFPRLDPTFLFYTRRHSTPLCEGLEASACDAAQLAPFLDRPDRVFLFAERDDWAKLDPKPVVYEIARDADEREGYIFFTNQPLAPTPPAATTLDPSTPNP